MWLILLAAVAYSPLQIFIPIFLQSLHGLDPLSAGYGVACASLGWTAAALLVAGAPDDWRARFILIGPLTMAVSLVAAGLFADCGRARCCAWRSSGSASASASAGRSSRNGS